MNEILVYIGLGVCLTGGIAILALCWTLALNCLWKAIQAQRAMNIVRHALQEYDERHPGAIEDVVN